MAYRKAIFFVPVRFGDFNRFANQLLSTGMWNAVDGEKIAPRYLLSYAVRIAKDQTLFRAFDIKKECIPDIYVFEKELNLKQSPVINNVRFSCFSTGVGFLEFRLEFSGMSAEEIADFSYLFKKAAKMNGKEMPEGKVSLHNAAKSLLPSGGDGEIFFTASADFKYECLAFHYIQLQQNDNKSAEADFRLTLLKRSYNSSFGQSADSDYDMIYKPYSNDHWGGSTEGLVNISYDTDPDEENYFLRNYKEEHLSVDYYFMYLLLLNQRFSAIQYILEIAEGADSGKNEMETINKRIVRLKTVFSFRIISDDQIFQNVYAKMYKVLDIDCLLEDIRDNENQSELLMNISSAKVEKRSNQFLLGISLLSLFSALIDASSYFDRINFLRPVATSLGFLCTILVFVFCAIMLFVNRRKK